MTAPAIAVDRISKSFRIPTDHAFTLQYRFAHPVSSSRGREFHALRDVSFNVEAGEFLGITGPNGCGKSTLLKILARIYTPDAGRVAIHGRVSPFLELGVGFKSELTARENIFLGGAVLGLTRGLIAPRVHQVLEFAELVEFADQKIKNFSSGMVVRLAFAVAMLADAEILLMDEVLAVGDAHFQEKCFDVFDEYRRTGRTTILVTHDLGALEANCDRVVLLQGGQVIGNGPPAEVAAQYRQIIAASSDQGRESGTWAGTYGWTRRWGSRDVEVLRVRLIGEEGADSASFLTGQQMSIAIDYRINTAINGAVCSFGIRHSQGHTLAAPNTNMPGRQLPVGAPGFAATATYVMEAVRLLAGTYTLDVALYDAHQVHAFDHIEGILSFRVSDTLGRHGLMDLGGSWR